MKQVFDLNKERPKVLLVGNGLLRSKGNHSWDKMIKKLSSENNKEIDLSETVPYSLKATVLTDFDDNKRYSKYYDVFSNGKYKYTDNHLLNKLIKLPFDAILTTNYTYEIEYALDNEYPQYSEKKKRAFSYLTKGNDSKYNICRYNKIPSYYNKEIWHIHGEQRRKSSMILTHDEYSKLIYKIVDYLKTNGNNYEKNIESLEFDSWIDYFILGDLYIVGQGFDFSEFDLWWLLNRRKRERINQEDLSNVIMYNPLEDGANTVVCDVLDKMGAKIESFNLSAPHDKNENNDFYNRFYELVINDIERKIKY